MNKGGEIRIALKSLMIGHTAYSNVLQTLRRRVQETFDKFPPCFEMLIAPSRCGKTELLKVIANEFPPVNEVGRRQIPLLSVEISSGMGPKDLPTAVIRALGLPVPKGSNRAGELNTFMFHQLALAKVKVILFDEASHLVDVGTKIPPRAASDWFKAFQVSPNEIGVVMTGVPRLTRLLNFNEQLRNRSHKPLNLMPYRYDDREERKAFAGCVSAFLSEFRNRGCALGQPFDEFVRHAYAASAGHIGLLSRFFMEVATVIDAPCEITHAICAKACLELNLPGDGAVRPFTQSRLSDIDLMHILASELDRYDLMLAPFSVVSELAQVRVAENRSVTV